MRLRRSGREPGPTAAHNSRYGPKDAPRIASIQRDAIYRQIFDQLRNGDDMSILVEQNDLGAARRLAREVSDDLQLILDALGWGETSSDGVVELTLPPEQLRRTFSRLHERAVEQREASSRGSTETQPLYERALIVIETCDEVLEMIGSNAEAAHD